MHCSPNAPTFRRTCARFATGITIVTTVSSDGTPHGLTVNSFTSVSCNPPLVSVCIDLGCRSLPHLRTGSHFGISVLTENQQDLSERFSDCEDARFDGIAWSRGISGVPLIEGALAWFECRLDRAIDAGDHVILLGAVERTATFEGQPLLYYASRYTRVAP
jgi:flavin reductase (DIM6/NTAB) family NADH-FMN oxidoreductase RutF